MTVRAMAVMTPTRMTILLLFFGVTLVVDVSATAAGAAGVLDSGVLGAGGPIGVGVPEVSSGAGAADGTGGIAGTAEISGSGLGGVISGAGAIVGAAGVGGSKAVTTGVVGWIGG